MKTTLKLIGIIFLISSCNCLTIKNDTRRVWSAKFNECRCQWYSFENIEPTSKLISCEDHFKPIREQEAVIKSCLKEDYRNKFPENCDILPNEQYCDDLVGFSATSWGNNITPRAKESKRCLEDTCKK